jgi:hypothetical protein
MARTKKRNLIYHQGDTFNDIQLTYLDSDNVVINLTGFVVAMKIKTADLVTTVVTIDSDQLNGITVSAPLSGVIDFDATPAQMTALVPGTAYVYDIQITDGTIIETLLKGNFRVDAEVTDA